MSKIGRVLPISPSDKEILQYLPTFLFANTNRHSRTVIQRVTWHIEHTAHRTRAGILTAKHDTVHAGIDNGSGTHGTRLQGNIQRAIMQPPAADLRTGLLNGKQLGVSGRSMIAFPSVPR